MNAKEARLSEAEVGYDLGEENTVDGVRTHVFPVCEKVIKMMKSLETTTSPALGSPCIAVGGRWLDWNGTRGRVCTGWRWTLSVTFGADRRCA